MVNALLMFAAAGIGFGGKPWSGFAIGATLIFLFGIPQQLASLKRYAGQPKADIILVMLVEIGLAVAGTFACAWAGFGLRHFLMLLLQR